MTSEYKTLAEWKKDKPSAYSAAVRQDLIEKICTTFGWDNTSLSGSKRARLTKEVVAERALEFQTMTRFRGIETSAYEAAKRNGWLEEVTKHFIRPTLFDREAVLEIANKLDNYFQFTLPSCKKARKAAEENGWIDEVMDMLHNKEIETRRKISEDIAAYLKTDQYKEWEKEQQRKRYEEVAS